MIPRLASIPEPGQQRLRIAPDPGDGRVPVDVGIVAEGQDPYVGENAWEQVLGPADVGCLMLPCLQVVAVEPVDQDQTDTICGVSNTILARDFGD